MASLRKVLAGFGPLFFQQHREGWMTRQRSERVMVNELSLLQG